MFPTWGEGIRTNAHRDPKALTCCIVDFGSVACLWIVPEASLKIAGGRQPNFNGAIYLEYILKLF